MSMRFQHKAEYALTAFFARFFRMLPAEAATALGMSLGGLGYKLLGIRKRVMLENLKRVFPERSEEDLQKIALKSYCHWGGMTAEFARLPRMDAGYIEKYVEFTGEDVLFEAEKIGRGGLVISGHLGNWEIMGCAATQRGHKVTYVVATQSNRLVDEMMDRYRRAQGIELWKMGKAPRGVFKSLKDNRFVALMIDQDAGKDCVFVDFFGKKAATHRGPAVFHLKTGAPLILSSCIRVKGVHYKIAFERVELEIPEGSIEERTTYIMRELNKLLEAQIRKYPEQYFWMHKRWKTRPAKK